MAGHWNALSLLTHLLDGGELEDSIIEQAARSPISEGVHLDYKGWPWFQDKDAAASIRKWVAGFANSDGGVLLIGLRRDPNAVSYVQDGDPSSAHAQNPEERVSRALTDVAHMLWPQPRIKVSNYQGKPVVAIAVARAPNLVWCVEDRRPTYFLRLEDQTLKAPEYLHADIVTGRRTRPEFSMRIGDGGSVQETSPAILLMNIPLVVTNESLLWVDRVMVGCIGYQSTGFPHPTESILRYVDVRGCALGWPTRSNLVLAPNIVGPLNPFVAFTVGTNVAFGMPAVSSVPFVWTGVIYVLPPDSPPTFWQLEIRRDNNGKLSRTLDRLRHDQLGVAELKDS